MRYVLLCVAFACCFGGRLPAAEKEAPASQPTSRPADIAKETFGAAASTAQNVMDAAVCAAAKEYLNELNTALNSAMTAGKLDESNRIKSEIVQISNGAPPVTDKPRRPELLAARVKFDRAISKARDDFHRGMETARRQYASDLQLAVKVALQEKKLEEANRINEVIEQIKKHPPDPPVATSPVASVHAGKPQTLDLLKSIDLDRDTVLGLWRLDRDGLVSGEEQANKRLRLPYRPPAEYDFSIEFTVLKPVGFGDLDQFCYAGNQPFGWFIDANRNYGFASIDDLAVHMVGNPTQLRGAALTPGQRYKSVVHVRRDSIAASLDGKELANYKTHFANMSLRYDWAIGTDILGLGTWNSTRFHKIEVTEISEPGRPIQRMDLQRIGVISTKWPARIGSAVSLLDLDPVAVQVGYDQFRKNEMIEDAPVIVDGATCDRYLFAHSPSSVTYSIPKGAMGFRTIAMSTSANKAIRCVIYIDGNEALISKPLQETRGQAAIALPLPKDAKQIELRFQDTWVNRAWSTWAYPEFVFPAE